MFEVIGTPLEGLKIIKTCIFQDSRGIFKKIFSAEEFSQFGFETEFKESYFSVNKKNVIRGMHFQIPPADHVKIVYVVSGKITDVVLDIRKKSKTYGKVFSIELNAEEDKFIYIPKGFAHGFLSHEDGTIVHYLQTSCYDSKYDCGISYDSIDYNWYIRNPIVSARDLSHPKFIDFKSLF